MPLKVKASELLARPINTEKDINFLLSTWLQSYRSSDFANAIANDDYFPNHQILIMSILGHENNAVTVVCDPEEQDQIIGYIVFNTKAPIVYYCYVKHAFRKLGIAAWMFNSVREGQGTSPGGMTTCTHKCRRWPAMSKKFNLAYNPYLVRE